MSTRQPTSAPPAPHPATTAQRSRRTWSRRRVAGVVAAGFLVVSSFQVALALGAPSVLPPFGGANAGPLPPELRLVSAVAAGFWLVAALHALSRGGVTIAFHGWATAGSRGCSSA